MEWQSIDSAEKDETVPILVWFDHDADTCNDPRDMMRLTDYAANAEGGDYLSGKGVALAVWRNGYPESEGWESGDSYWVPGGWFAWLNGDATDYAVNALWFMPLPTPPVDEDSDVG